MLCAKEKFIARLFLQFAVCRELCAAHIVIRNKIRSTYQSMQCSLVFSEHYICNVINNLYNLIKNYSLGIELQQFFLSYIVPQARRLFIWRCHIMHELQVNFHRTYLITVLQLLSNKFLRDTGPINNLLTETERLLTLLVILYCNYNNSREIIIGCNRNKWNNNWMWNWPCKVPNILFYEVWLQWMN